jgi:hypothetical protein
METTSGLRARSLEGLGSPPRAVPLVVRIDELFGGPLASVGWLLLGFGLIFAWGFGLNADFASWRFRGPLSTAQATTAGCRGTTFSEGGGKHRRGNPIYENSFSFEERGRAFSNRSYSFVCMAAGQPALAEFPAGRPDLARLRGMRRAPFSQGVLIVLIVPALGLAFALSALLTGVRDIRLLERGILARGAVAATRPTSMTINRRVVWEVTLAFRDGLGAERRMTTKTCFPEKLEGEGVHNVFYDPENPAGAIAVDTLPEPLFADESGGLVSDGWPRAARALLCPALTVLGHGLYWLVRLAR